MGEAFPTVLWLGLSDWANTSNRVARAMNATAGRRVARVYTAKRHPFGYVEDLVGVGGREELRAVAAQADWVISSGDGGHAYFRQMLKILPLRRGTRIGVRHAGSAYRAQPQIYDSLDRELGVRARFVAADLYRFCADDPVAVPYYQTHGGIDVAEKAEGRLRVSHSPSTRAKKGTEMILAALQALDIDLDVIEGVPFEECVRRRASSRVFVDQLMPTIGGFGACSIEAMAAGCVAISDLRHIHPKVWEFVPKPPIVDVQCAADLRRTVADFATDRASLEAHAARTVAWVRAHADPAPVAHYWRRHLEQLA